MRDGVTVVCIYVVANVKEKGSQREKKSELTSEICSRCLKWCRWQERWYRQIDRHLTGYTSYTVFLKRYKHRSDIEYSRRLKSFHYRLRKSLSEISYFVNDSIDGLFFSKRTVERNLHFEWFHKRPVKGKNCIREVIKKKKPSGMIQRNINNGN